MSSGGQQSPQMPQQPTTGGSVTDWVENMPKVFAEQQRQAPLEAQQQLQLLQQYGLPIGQAIQDINAGVNPNTAALQEHLAGQALERSQGDMPDWMKDQYRSEFNANLGTNAGSPMGADYMSRGMIGQQKGYQDYYRNLGLSLASRQPLAQAQSPQTTNYMQGFTPQAVMGSNAQNYGTAAGLYGNIYGANQASNQSMNQMYSQLGGGLMGGIGTFMAR
ncbi:MAG: hypothetical protein GY861_01420 [bacterium]|nr:hypothetical protein [bacterium]